MPALRDILNHYLLNSVVTFEMVELSLENRKNWFTQFSETGRYQLFVAEEAGEVVVTRKSAFPPASGLCSFGDEQYLSPSEHTGRGSEKKYIPS